MSCTSGAKINDDGLVFHYDMSNTTKSWKGKPTTNYYSYSYPNYVAYSTGTPVITYISSSITRLSTTSGVDSNAISWQGGNYGANADTNTKLSYSMKVRGIGETWLTVHQANLLPNSGHAGISTSRIQLTGEWQTISLKDFYHASDVTAQNLLINISGVGSYVEFKEPQIEFSDFPTSYTLAGTTRSNTDNILDLTKNNTITATSLTYNSDNTFSFNGTSDYITTPVIPNTTTGSISLMFKMNVLKNYNTLFDNLYGADTWEMWVYSNGVLAFRTTADNSDIRHDLSGFNISEWYHVTLTWESTGSKIYINGIITSTDATVATRTIPLQLNIGGALNTKIDGEIPIFNVYNRALSADEIKENFEAVRGRFNI